MVGINELDSLTALLSIRITSTSGETVFSKDIRTEWNEGVSTLLSQQIDTRSLRGGYTVTATLSAEDGSIVTQNDSTFDVFNERDLALPETRIAVLDLDGPLTRFLKQQGLDVVELDASTPGSTAVFVTRLTVKSPADQQRFADLMRFIKSGGTAVYIQGVGKYYQRDASNQVRTPTIPFATRVEAAQGPWTCIPHLVRNHPIFAGLPADGMMRDIYENVWAR